MTVLTARPSFGLQTAYFGNALAGKSTATAAPQAPAFQTAPQFGCGDEVQFGMRTPARGVKAFAVGTALLALAGCGGAAVAGNNDSGSGSRPVATASAQSGDICASGSISKSDAYQALSQQTGLSAAQLQAKLKDVHPNAVYGLSLLNKQLITQVLANSKALGSLSTVNSSDAPVAAAATALQNLVMDEAQKGRASHPAYAGEAAAIDLVIKYAHENNTKAFEGGGDVVSKLLAGAAQRLRPGNGPLNYTGLNKDQLNPELKSALINLFGNDYYKETMISFTMQPPVKISEKPALADKVQNASKNC